jgi:hypothetical protein
VTSDKVGDPGFHEGDGQSPRRSEDDTDHDLDENWDRGRDRGDSDRDRINDDEGSEPSEPSRRNKPWERDNNSDAVPDADDALEGFQKRFSPNASGTPDDFSEPDEFRAPDEAENLSNEPRNNGDDGLDGLQPTDDGQLNFKPELRPPLDKSDDNVDKGSDSIVPPAGSEAARESRLYRGLLTADQARTHHFEVSFRFRVAGQRLRQQRRPAQLSGQNNKKSRALKWIGAPATGGRVRL